MHKVKAVLTLSAAMLALCSARTAWAQVACNGSTPAPCINPSASDSVGNTAGGTGALLNPNDGHADYNTAFGFDALTANVAGSANNTGVSNSAFGWGALYSNTSGAGNSAFGKAALNYDTIGFANSAFGNSAMLFTTTGEYNSAFGSQALQSNTRGDGNAAFGALALITNTEGNNNLAIGDSAMYYNLTGSDNIAVGNFSLYYSTGNSNIAIGYGAANNLTSGSNNIYLSSPGGAATESGIIRIGANGTQTAAYIAGIHGVRVGDGALVVVNSKGQLGTILSSARYKDGIQDMGGQSDRLAQLRPVTFHYKSDPAGEQQYGLIAEEVAKVYPDLVVHGEHGEVESVQYHQLIPMLLNELQKEQKQIKEQSAKLDAEAAELANLRAQSGEIDALKVAVQKLQKAQSTLQAANFITSASVASR